MHVTCLENGRSDQKDDVTLSEGAPSVPVVHTVSLCPSPSASPGLASRVDFLKLPAKNGSFLPGIISARQVSSHQPLSSLPPGARPCQVYLSSAQQEQGEGEVGAAVSELVTETVGVQCGTVSMGRLN